MCSTFSVIPEDFRCMLLRGNITDLRRDMMNLRKQLDESRNLQEAASSLQTSIISTGKTNVPMVSPRKSPIATYTPSAEDAEAEEIETEPESLNLNDLGRQMVEKALERNDGSRKKAAQELGISDRTLYRRIKQYGLDKK